VESLKNSFNSKQEQIMSDSKLKILAASLCERGVKASIVQIKLKGDITNENSTNEYYKPSTRAYPGN